MDVRIMIMMHYSLENGFLSRSDFERYEETVVAFYSSPSRLLLRMGVLTVYNKIPNGSGDTHRSLQSIMWWRLLFFAWDSLKNARQFLKTTIDFFLRLCNSFIKWFLDHCVCILVHLKNNGKKLRKLTYTKFSAEMSIYCSHCFGSGSFHLI